MENLGDVFQYVKSNTTNTEISEDSILPIDDIDLEAEPAVLVCNHGRWLVECPTGDGHVQFAFEGAPFMCFECWNSGINGKWRPVNWPITRRAIEVLLGKRPSIRNRNWLSNETVADLVRQNKDRGIG